MSYLRFSLLLLLLLSVADPIIKRIYKFYLLIEPTYFSLERNITSDHSRCCHHWKYTR